VWSVLFALGLAFAPAEAGVDLRWGADRACPTGVQVLERAGRLLGRQVDSGHGQVGVQASIVRRGGSFELELELRTEGGTSTQTVSSQECDVLADVAAMKIALAIDPLAVLQNEAAPVPAVEPAEPAEVAPAPAEAPPAPVDAGHDRRPRLGLRAQSGVTWGVLPGVGAGLGGAAAIVGRRWRAEARGLFHFGRTATVPGTEAAGEFRMTAAALHGCGVPTVASVEFPLCAGLEVGSMRGEGTTLSISRVSRRLWVAVSLAPALAWAPSRRLALWVQPEVLIPVVRSAFEVDDLGMIHRAGAVAVRGFLGVEIRLP
jgi:hypothetical protein